MRGHVEIMEIDFLSIISGDLRFIVFDFNDPSKSALAQCRQNFVARLNDVAAVINQMAIGIVFHRRRSLWIYEKSHIRSWTIKHFQD